MGIAAFLRSWSQSIDRFICAWGRVDDPAFLCLLALWCSEDSQRTFPLLAVPSTDVHPARYACFAVGWGYFAIDRRYARRPKGVHATQRALVMAFGLGDLLLSQSRSRCGGKLQAASEKSLHRDQKRRTSPPGFSRCLKACLLLSNHSSRQRR